MSESLRLEIEEGIRRILISELGINPAVVAQCRSTTPLLGRGIGLDSIEAMALTVGIEAEFDIFVEDEDLTVDLFKDIATLAEYVLQLTTRG